MEYEPSQMHMPSTPAPKEASGKMMEKYTLPFLKKVKNQLEAMRDNNKFFVKKKVGKFTKEHFDEFKKSDGIIDLDNDVKQFLYSVTPEQFETYMNEIIEI